MASSDNQEQDEMMIPEEEVIDGMSIVDDDAIDPLDDAIDPIDGIIDPIDPIVADDVFANTLLLADEPPEEKIEEEEDDFKEMADYMYGNYDER